MQSSIRKRKESYHQKKRVIPSSFCSLVYSGLHVDMGSLGAERLTDLAKDRYF